MRTRRVAPGEKLMALVAPLIVSVWLLPVSARSQQPEIPVTRIEFFDLTYPVVVEVGGTPDRDHMIETSTDMQNWTTRTTFNTPDGSFVFPDTIPPDTSAMFYHARLLPVPLQIEYAGSSLVLAVDGLEPGSQLHFDIDGDDIFETWVQADANGLATVSLDVSADPPTIEYFIRDADGTDSGVVEVVLTRTSPVSPAAAVPVNLVPPPLQEPGICAVSPDVRRPFDLYMRSYTPTVHGNELVTGKIRSEFPVTDFKARLIGFDLALYHASLVDYPGPFGCGMSHTMNMMIVRTGSLSGQIVTPDLRIFPIVSGDGVNWDLPEGFFSRLVYDDIRHRWTMTHYSGLQFEFYEGQLGEPGYPVRVTEPNGNRMVFRYNTSGMLTEVVTSLGQVQQFTYDASNRLQAFTDHLGHTWTFTLDPNACLTEIATPAIEYVDGPVGMLFTDDNVAAHLVVAPRVTTLEYSDSAYPTHITALVDGRRPRTTVPLEYAYDPASGRVTTALINGFLEVYDYAPVASPPPLSVLDPGNTVVRVVDRDGNVHDYETHSDIGGPIGGSGRGGLRRLVVFTETAKGGPPLRSGEPGFWEQRWLHDSDCLRAAKVSETFSSIDASAITFDAEDMPATWPRVEYTYNANRQVLTRLRTDGTENIKTVHTYQPNSYGDSNQYSLPLTTTDPRQFDTHPVSAGMNYLHHYVYDSRGNLERYEAPSVSRGGASRSCESGPMTRTVGASPIQTPTITCEPTPIIPDRRPVVT